MTIEWKKTAGPFATLAEAEAEKAILGDTHSIVATVDSSDRAQYYIEKMVIREYERPTGELIFGRPWGQIQAMQRGRGDND